MTTDIRAITLIYDKAYRRALYYIVRGICDLGSSQQHATPIPLPTHMRIGGNIFTPKLQNISLRKPFEDQARMMVPWALRLCGWLLVIGYRGEY